MPDDPHLGKTYGNVRMTARLGTGAMGAVYRGWHERFSREVAVKVLLNTHAKGSVKERFLREGQAAAKVRHDNVVQVMDAGEHNGVAYLVMELVDGFSLGRIVEEHGPLLPEMVARLGAQIALGLAAIHAKGIIHRDIKPDNILLSADKQVKITDLGLAKQTDDPDLNRLTATGMVVGTPLYVSPESIQDPRTATASADIYSLGATLYHLLTGKPPFHSPSPFEVMRAHIELPVPPIHGLRPEVPAGLAQLVERCLAKSPAQRPTALEVAKLLSRGANFKASANVGLTLLLTIATLVVVGGATGGWFVFQAVRERAASTPPPSAIVVVRSTLPNLRARIDSGPWLTLGEAGLAAAPGAHHLRVEANQPGPLLRWEGAIDLTINQRTELSPVLAPVAVSEVRIPLPGEGMLYADGLAYGLEPAWLVSKAGTFALARWDGTDWQSCTATVDERGQVVQSPVVKADHPAGPAWWRSRDDDGLPLAPHHIVSWWEVERARELVKLPPPPGWLVEGQRREQPASGMTSGLVSATRDWLAAVGELPNGQAAARWNTTLRVPVWCNEVGRIGVVGGAPVAAQMLLVPPTPSASPALAVPPVTPTP